MMEFDVLNSLACDDARREMNGKEILIGVYPGNITVLTLPATINCCFWMEILPKLTGNLIIDAKIELNGKGVAQMKIEAVVQKAKESFGLATPQMNFTVMEDSEVKLHVRAVNQVKWKFIRKMKISYTPASIFTPASSSGMSSDS